MIMLETVGVIAIAFISIVIILSVYFLYRRRTQSRFNPSHVSDPKGLAESIKFTGMKMLSSRSLIMSFNDDKSIYATIANLKNWFIRNNKYQNYTYFNFPICFLLLGLIDSYEKSQHDKILNLIERKCRDFVTTDGKLTFSIDRLDQAMFGQVFLSLYRVTQDQKYLNAAHLVFIEVQKFRRDDGLYRYRSGLDIFFIDAVGLLCPFLVSYAEVAGNEAAQDDAARQVDFALTNCTEPRSGLALHAYDLTRAQPLGSVNWARGMGWFMLGLAAVARSGGNPAHHDMLRVYADMLDDLREPHGFWPQFLGHTNNRQIDSSATLMFLHAVQSGGLRYVKGDQLLRLARQCVDRHGRVVQSSGDTIYINQYARTKGPSELSQGLMLSVVAGMAS